MLHILEQSVWRYLPWRYRKYRHKYRLFGGMSPDITGRLRKEHKQKSPDLQGFVML